MFKRRQPVKRLLCVLISLVTLLGLFGCSGGSTVKLDPKNPVTVTIWHYYNGAILNAFDSMVKEFNNTVGKEKGIIVEGFAHGNVTELEKAVMDSANKEVGSSEMPNIFASYADTAYEAEVKSLLANLGDYLSAEERAEYMDSYIREGEIGLGGELRIFPTAKSTEVMLLNDTDWQDFAGDNQLSYDDLLTLEGIARVSALYYDWTDKKTPETQNDGKSFFGRDSMANLFIIASKEFGTEIFHVENGRATININETAMRKIWDCYYVPYISGYYTAVGRYRSDDAAVGDLLAYVGSTSSAAYFPREVTLENETHAIVPKVLPVPHFEDGERVIVQQGAGMVVTNSTPELEYASVEFLKWFTDVENNIAFSAMSAYMPVKKAANVYDDFIRVVGQSGQKLEGVTEEILKVVFEEISTSELYTNKAFSGGADARKVLERSLQDKANADREELVALLEDGVSHSEAVARYDTDENFQNWLTEFTDALNAVCP